MRILYITNYQGARAVKRRGHRRNRTLGAGRKVELIARGLAARGHEVDVVSAATASEGTLRCFGGSREREEALAGAEVVYLPGIDAPRINLLVASLCLSRHLQRAPRYDVVMLYNLEWYFFRPVVEYSVRCSVPMVLEYEDDALAVAGVRLKAWHISRGQKAIEVARSLVRGVVAVSPELQRQLGVKNSIVLPGIVGQDLLSIPRPGRLPQTRLVRLAYSGGIYREKGPDILVEAASRVRGIQLQVDIVGGGEDLERLRLLARSARVPVTVHGEVPRARLVEVLAAADLAVNPHRVGPEQLGQIFPFKMLEYLGAGLPVVTSRLGEFHLPRTDALVTYPEDRADSLAAAIEDAAKRLPELSHAASAARAWVASEYSTEAAARKIELVCFRAINEAIVPC